MKDEGTLINGVRVFITGTTCGEACWEAKEEICRCSCGGKNHGCMKNQDGTVRPARTCKMNGHFYTLKGVSGTVEDVNPSIEHIAQEITFLSGSTYYYEYGQPYAAARLKKASISQIDKWAELAAYIPAEGEMYPAVYLLWVRNDKADLYAQALQNFENKTDRFSKKE